MIINHNIPAMNTNRQLGINNTATSKSLEKLSSGLRINRAGDDAAGLAISEKMRSQIRGLDQAIANSQDGISMINIAEGALNETHSILQRMRELADKSANGTNTAADRLNMQDEISQLTSEIDRIGNTTEFNTMKLLNGSLAGSSGVSSGTNSTTGAIVADLSSGKATGTTVMSSTAGVTAFGKDVFVVDGQEIDVDWNSLLNQDEKDLMKTNLQSATAQTIQKVVDLAVNTINKAIDNSGTGVGHINGYKDASSNQLVLESSKEGIHSEVTFKTSSGTGGVGDILINATTANKGLATYNGGAATGVMIAEINGVSLKVTVNSIATGTSTMAASATQLQTDINSAITTYNTNSGKSAGQEGYIEKVSVTASEDGRFVIGSDSGPISFSDQDGATIAKNLGLSQSQTESGGNGGMTLQIGANRGQTLTFGINDMRSAALGVSGVNVSSQGSASKALDTLDSAIAKVSRERSKLGAVTNRLEHTIANLGTASENMSAAESNIRDVNMAKEMMSFQKNNILSQAAQSMLAQANQQPQGVLQLLR